MSPEEFLRSLKRSEPAGVYLFVGPEIYGRSECRRALVEKVLPPEDRETGLTRLDMDDVTVSHVLDDARSMSLFAANRVIWVSSAEGALPRGRAGASAAGADEEDDGESKPKATGAEAEIAAYAKDPTPGTVIVFDAARFDFEGEDKTKSDRVRKFFAAAQVVEFARFTPAAARSLAAKLASEAGVTLAPGIAELLSEALAHDAARIAAEIEKLALFAGRGTVGEDEIAALVPNARSATIFNLVAAIGRNDRRQSLDLLDTLVREGEYLPLALAFIGTQFRLALAAREAGVTNAGQIQTHFSRLGIAMWRSRAEQVQQTLAAFSKAKLVKGLSRVFEADRALRDARPDDRTVMESLILQLTD